MKIILDLALSADGYIAKPDGNSDWVSERTEELFKSRIREAGCLVVGSRTFNQYQGSIYPVAGALNIILTHQNTHISNENNLIYATSPESAIKIAEDHNCSGILLAGGASISKAFLQKDFIDEIYFSKHPILLGKGMKPFGDVEVPIKIKLLNTLDLGEGVVQEHYILER